MEGLSNPFVLQPENFRPLASQAQIDRALEEFFLAKDEDRLCAPDAYDLLFSLGYLNERVDDGR